MDRIEIQARLTFWKDSLKDLQAAYLELIKGGVKSYKIHNRELTRFDLPDLKDEILAAEQKVDELEAMLAGGRPRNAVGVMPRDW